MLINDRLIQTSASRVPSYEKTMPSSKLMAIATTKKYRWFTDTETIGSIIINKSNK